MFKTLTDQLHGIFSKLAGQKKLSEDNVSEAVREVRVALLEADVNYAVVKTLIHRIKEKSLGEEVLKSVTPSQQFIKCVHDELAAMMGGKEVELDLTSNPAVIMLAGLQGSGKTTTAAKLARYVMKKCGKKKPLLVAADLQRPAAIDQLRMLGEKNHIEVFTMPHAKDPVKVVEEAMRFARAELHDVVIVDTAGRLHIDEVLMKELEQVKAAIKPKEILFVVNATIGQDAVNVAREFNESIAITGTVLTMLDGNTRGGSAISITEVTGKPLKFECVGENIEDIQLFSPDSMADRILGMGDTINLVRKAEEHMDEKEAEELEKKLRQASFTYRDYLKQMQMVKKMGSMKSIMGMLPGMSQLKDMDFDEAEFFKVEAIILSMTEEEREEKCELIPSRRRRIASGSGVHIDAVNKLVKSFKQAKQFFKNMPNMKQLEKMFGGNALWR